MHLLILQGWVCSNWRNQHCNRAGFTGALGKTNWGWEHLKTVPLAGAQHPPHPPQADLPENLLWEMVSHPHFSHLTLHIQQHFKCVRNRTKKLFASDWHNPQTKTTLSENNLITNYQCSDHFLLWVWASTCQWGVLIQDWGLQIIQMCAGWLPAAAQQLFRR